MVRSKPAKPQMRHFDKITFGALSKLHIAGPWKPPILWILLHVVWLWLAMTFSILPVFTPTLKEVQQSLSVNSNCLSSRVAFFPFLLSPFFCFTVKYLGWRILSSLTWHYLYFSELYKCNFRVAPHVIAAPPGSILNLCFPLYQSLRPTRDLCSNR